MSFGGESDLRKVGLDGIHPLTQRYEPSKKLYIWSKSCFLVVNRVQEP
ncbi:TPA: DUF3265 domain-containing protein [Vibrio vulnificus]|nr:DUF3265 domain-containing protein [Vibrio vulnificus]